MKIQNILYSILTEDIEIPNIPNTTNFWHGGNLSEYNESIAQKNGRYEYGAGLYLITKYDIAKKYSKGSRKLYLVTVENGNDISDSYLTQESVISFINTHVIGHLRKLVIERISKHIENERIDASVFNNIILNTKAIKSTKTSILRQFFIQNNIDYELVNNAFGFGETMMVLYNMKKIVNVKRIETKDKITIFDL